MELGLGIVINTKVNPVSDGPVNIQVDVLIKLKLAGTLLPEVESGVLHPVEFPFKGKLS